MNQSEKIKNLMFEMALWAEKLSIGDIEKNPARFQAYEVKDNHSWVTPIDQQIERGWRQMITKVFPHASILGEEEENDPHFKKNFNEGLSFFIDPIDGTSNFICRLPFFCHAIGIYEGGRPLAGMVHAPLLRKSYWAYRGEGAFENQSRMRPAPLKQLDQAMMCFPHIFKVAPQSALLQLSQKKYHSIRLFGAAALESAYVASGLLDCFFHHQLQPWDIACSAMMLEETGCVLLNERGEKADPFSQQYIVATSDFYQLVRSSLW